MTTFYVKATLILQRSSVTVMNQKLIFLTSFPSHPHPQQMWFICSSLTCSRNSEDLEKANSTVTLPRIEMLIIVVKLIVRMVSTNRERCISMLWAICYKKDWERLKSVKYDTIWEGQFRKIDNLIKLTVAFRARMYLELPVYFHGQKSHNVSPL